MKEIIKSVIPKFTEFKSTLCVLYKHCAVKEDWFVCTLMNILNELKKDNKIKDFKIEQDNIDLLIELEEEKVYCEIKNWIDKTRATINRKENGYLLSSWLGNKSGFWNKDFDKLFKKKEEGHKAYFMIFYLAKDYDNETKINKTIEIFSENKNIKPDSINIFKIVDFCYLILFQI